MTTVSYAQNYEDIMLLRALGDVERGFYVDVGAQDPIVDSVTKLFYERGWRGINIEPVQHWFERLRQDRPEDVSLHLLVTDQPGTAVLHEVAGTGLSTMDDALAASHARAGREVVRHTLECATLDSILAKYGQTVIHFLKVDVEGAEELVLRGLSLQQHRPWILVIEACAPNSTVATHGAWEPTVLAAGYRFVYFDGLNRFYLAEEQASRAAAFAAPPNVLDDFIRFGDVAERDARIQQWRARSAELSDHAERLQQLADARDAEVHALQSRVEEWSTRAAELSRHIQGLQHLADARQAEVSSLQSRIAEWSARASELSDQAQHLQQLADGRQAQLIEATQNAAREIAIRDAKLVDTKAALLEAQTGRDMVEMELQRREELLAQILSSWSWRMTRPLRVLARLRRNGPEELAGALRERMGPGKKRGRMIAAVLRFVPGVRLQPDSEPVMPAATGERLAEAASNADLLSDQGAAALAAMDRARGWHAPGQERR